jgi:uncharacterized protein (DUF4213/DUF364 family)
MKINHDYLQLGKRLYDALGNPNISGLYLPAPVEDETFRDEFGFVLLDDGSVGPFYVSMGDILKTLWKRYPEPLSALVSTLDCLQGFEQQDQTQRALAVGCYNALSASLFLQAGFYPTDRAPHSGLDGIDDGDRVGMVGYFCPLVDQLVARDCEVMVLELAPERVAERNDVTLAQTAADLRDCTRVLCSASVLINDSLQPLIDALDGATPLELIGPSGSGLPEPLFSRGVASVGGIMFDDQENLLASLARGDKWSSIGRKYQLTPSNYPGVDTLLSR